MNITRRIALWSFVLATAALVSGGCAYHHKTHEVEIGHYRHHW